MKKAVPRCHKMLKESCTDKFDSMDCQAAYSFCSNEITLPYMSTGLNYYDISQPCEDPATLCYKVTACVCLLPASAHR